MNPKFAESGNPDLKIPLSTIAKFSGGTNASSVSSELCSGVTSTAAGKEIWPLELEFSSFMILARKWEKSERWNVIFIVIVMSDSWDLEFIEGSRMNSELNWIENWKIEKEKRILWKMLWSVEKETCGERICLRLEATEKGKNPNLFVFYCSKYQTHPTHV